MQFALMAERALSHKTSAAGIGTKEGVGILE